MDWEPMRDGAKDQVSGVEGTGPRKKWMKKGRVSAALMVEKSWVSEWSRFELHMEKGEGGRGQAYFGTRMLT